MLLLLEREHNMLHQIDARAITQVLMCETAAAAAAAAAEPLLLTAASGTLRTG
jgi:hypothetical protein